MPRSKARADIIRALTIAYHRNGGASNKEVGTIKKVGVFRNVNNTSTATCFICCGRVKDQDVVRKVTIRYTIWHNNAGNRHVHEGCVLNLVAEMNAGIDITRRFEDRSPTPQARQ